MKKILISGALVFSLLLAGCGNETTDNTTKSEEEQKTLAKTTEEVISAFKSDNLEVGEVSDLANDEFGNTRLEGKRIIIPSLGDDSGGRLFLFDNEEDLTQAKSYYDELSNSSPMLYSHTHQSDLFLFQMNGDMSDEDFAKYAASLDVAVTGSTSIDIQDNTDATENPSESKTLLDATIGDVVVDDFAGTYTIKEEFTAPTDTYKSADVNFTIESIKTATLKASDPELIETSTETNVLILTVNAENTSEATVSFHPDTAIMTTDTKRQIESNVMISSFESEFIGNVIQEGTVIFDLGEEGLEGVSELTFVFEGTAQDAMTIGDDVTVKLPI